MKAVERRLGKVEGGMVAGVFPAPAAALVLVAMGVGVGGRGEIWIAVV